VVRERLLDEQHQALARRIGAVVVERELGDVGVALGVREVHVQVAAVRRERETQEALLAAERHAVRQVEDDPRIRTRGERDHPPDLLGDVQRVIAGPHGHRDRLLELGHRHEPDPRVHETGLGRCRTCARRGGA
jgi:hypothetical protein